MSKSECMRESLDEVTEKFEGICPRLHNSRRMWFDAHQRFYIQGLQPEALQDLTSNNQQSSFSSLLPAPCLAYNVHKRFGGLINNSIGSLGLHAVTYGRTSLQLHMHGLAGLDVSCVAAWSLKWSAECRGLRRRHEYILSLGPGFETLESESFE